MNPPEPSNAPIITARFFLGVAAGIVFSLLFYGAVAMSVPSTLIPFLGAVAIKLFAGIALCFVPGWRPFGAGLLASMPIALMIFATLCFGAVIVLSR